MAKLKTIIKARYLRKEETGEEKILWRELRNNKSGVKFRRQHVVDMFILDFYAPKIRLAIELDGSPHRLEENREYDQARTDYLQSKYINELRFWNSEIKKNLSGVLNKIKRKITELKKEKPPL